ncbi:MAG: hypothetical protein MK100_03295 [Phycisphaerales bacterium]|nr:hypothetical protein [Phycisphaerales bacterium]
MNLLQTIGCSTLFGTLSTSILADSGLRVEDVAPPHAVAVMSLKSSSSLMERARTAGIVEDDDETAWVEMIVDVIQDGPDELSPLWEEVFKSEGAMDALSSVGMGAAIWVDPAESGPGALTIAGWIDLAEAGEQFVEAWNATWVNIREFPNVSTRTVQGRSVDVLEGDGGSERMSSGMWHAQEGALVLMSNDQRGMERLFDVLDGTVGDDALAHADAWQDVRDMLEGESIAECTIFIEPLFDAIAVFDDMGIGRMVQASFDAAIGPMRALSFQSGMGEGDVLAEMSGAIWMPDGKGGMLELMATMDDRGRLPDWISPSAIAISSMHVSFGSIPDWFRGVVASNPFLMGFGQLFEQNEPTIRSMIDPLGERMLMESTVTRPLTVDSLASVMRIDCTDPRSLSDALAASAPQVGLEPREFQGHQIWSTDPLQGMAMPVPGLNMGRLSMAVVGNALFLGQDGAVEAAIRASGTTSAEMPKWLDQADAYIPQTVCMWGARDLEAFMTTLVDIQNLQMKAWEEEVKAEDPELWEMIRGELVDEDEAAIRERLARLASAVGPLAWFVESVDSGFKIKIRVLSPHQSD